MRATILFALAGAGAAAMHVATATDGTVREWRQTVPLAALIGAALGLGFPRVAPGRPGALRGALLGCGALMLFAVLFALGHAVISRAGPAEAVATGLRSLRAMLGATGFGALALAALAGHLAARR